MEVLGDIFPDAGQTVADALYYSRQEKKHLRAALAGMVKHMGPLDYLLPMRMSGRSEGSGDRRVDRVCGTDCRTEHI